jgi:NADPH2:quinone reductase
MRALVVHGLDGPEGLVAAELPDPVPEEGQLLVEVHAAGIAFRDVLMTVGEYQRKPPLPFAPGAEVAGIVRAAPGSSQWRAGDRVAGATGDSGALAELALCDADFTVRLPDRVPFVAGAAVPINYSTALFALQRCYAEPGQTVLVQGASGGVGTATIQVARALGLRTIAVVSTDEKARLARELGSDGVVRSDAAWLEDARELTGGRGVDIVMDMVGGDRFTDSMRSLAVGGRLAVVGFAGGSIPEAKVNRLLLNNTMLVGVALGEYGWAHPGAAAKVMAEVGRLIEAGAIDPVIGIRVPMDEAATALRTVRDRGVLGKAVVEIRGEA